LTEPLSDVFTEWVPEEEEEVHHIAEPLGYVWIEVGSRKPKPGTELIHKTLATALLHKVHFNQEEFEHLNIDPNALKVDSYVKTGSFENARIWRAKTDGLYWLDYARKFGKESLCQNSILLTHQVPYGNGDTSR
jgi:hypothetical protein